MIDGLRVRILRRREEFYLSDLRVMLTWGGELRDCYNANHFNFSTKANERFIALYFEFKNESTAMEFQEVFHGEHDRTPVS